MNTKTVILSLVINTKNEESNIVRCIKSAEKIVDEIIVVDMQSTDKTVQLAKKLGARVYSIKDYSFADPARNFAFSKATGKWILALDADEVVSADLAKKIPNIIKKNRCDVVNIPFKSILYNKWMKHTGWWPDYHPRLFKKGFLINSSKVHTPPIIKGRIVSLEAKEENAIIHYTTKSTSGSLEKIDRYTSLETYFSKKKKITLEEVVNLYQREFAWRFFEQKGYLDGTRGFVFSKYMEFYRFMVFVKHWEKQNFPELCSPRHLKRVIETSGISSQLDEVNRLRADLDKIQSSKFYKLWQSYCRIRDGLTKKISLSRS